MTYYQPKYRPQDGYVADADELQVEFNRAEEALWRVDQNNLAPAGITTASFVASSSNARGLSITHSGGSLLFATATIASPPVTLATGSSDEVWVNFEDDNGVFELSFSTSVSSVMDFFGSLAYDASSLSQQPTIIDVRLLINGQPQDGYDTKSAETAVAGNVKLGLHAEARGVQLHPGRHSVTIQLRERGVHGGDITVAEIIGFGETRS